MFSTDDMEKLSLSPMVDKRRQVCQEMLQTEKNYVHMLQAIVKVGVAVFFRYRLLFQLFKEPLEQMVGDDRLLDSVELSLIFGKIQPILEVSRNVDKSFLIT
jgi:hypothetical protein